MSHGARTARRSPSTYSVTLSCWAAGLSKKGDKQSYYAINDNTDKSRDAALHDHQLQRLHRQGRNNGRALLAWEE
jgi:hypothetical protein